MLYRITNGTVSAGGQQILSHINFEIKGKEKIAVVGKNGAGKTTLLKLISGELELDRDDKRSTPGIYTSRKLMIGILNQSETENQDKTIEEILLEACQQKETFSKERFDYEVEYDKLFTGFGFRKEEKTRKLSSFSGGEQTKISFIRLLLLKPDILLLDEPTNHLDIPTLEWLEQYMKSYPNAVVFVSHDRFFLDQVVETVYELEAGRLRRYAGNYTAYRKQKVKELALEKKAYEKQQAELERLNGLVEKFKNKPRKAAFARSRKTMMERMERIEPPRENDVHIFTGAMEPEIIGSKWVFEAKHLKIGYDNVLAELSLRVKRGQKIGIIGDNGTGKSTFLKTAAGLLSPLGGEASLGDRTVFGYFDQQTASFSSQKSVVEHFRERFPAMTQKEVRQTLGAYLFGGREAAKRVDDLSGGEKSRLFLCELLCSRPNLLLLDEPTNHMDVQAKETLESAFSAYTGTILFVSHDRYFLDQVADAILVFKGGAVSYYPFGYSHYLEKCRNSDQDISAMIQAEDQALIAGLRAVPDKEKNRLREIRTEEAYLDWKLGLLKKPLREAREAAYASEQNYLEYLDEIIWQEEVTPEQRKKEAELRGNMEEKRQEWTQRCIEWYDEFTELE